MTDQPSNVPPPPPGPPMQPPAARKGMFELRGLTWWQYVLVILPLTLLILGGLIGGVVGAVGALSNVAIARSGLSNVVKVAVMIGVGVLCYVVVYIIAILLYAAAHPA